MNDDVLPPDVQLDDLLAVSGALDGVASSAERARIDAAPQLRDLLAELRSNAALVARVEVPAAVREPAVAAALAVYDELLPPSEVDRPRRVVHVDRRRIWYRTLAGAAAAVLVAVVAIAVNRSSNDPAEESSSVRDQSTSSAEAAPSAAAAAVAEGTAAPADDAAGDVMAATTGQAETAGSDPAHASPSPPTIGAIPSGGAHADVVPAIADAEQLADYVATTTADGSQRPHRCGPGDAEQLGDIRYQGELASVVREPESGEVMVFAADDCSLLVSLPG